MSIFGYVIKKKPPAQTNAGKDSELPEKEQPSAVSPSGSILSAEPHTGTRFNRKVIIGVVGVVILIGFFAMISALQPPKQLTPQEDAELKAQRESGKAVAYAATPDVIQEVPGSYGDISKYEADKLVKARKGGKYPKLGEPVPAVTGSLKAAAEGNSSVTNKATNQIGSVKDVSAGAIASYNAADNRQNRYAATQQISPEEKELIDARKSPIKFASFQGNTQAAANQDKKLANQGIAPGTLLSKALASGKGGEDDEPMDLLGGLGIGAALGGGHGGGKDDQNMQSEKRKFIDQQKKEKDRNFYVAHSLQKPLSPYEVKSGSIIPGVMITGINSDLPGNIVGQVRENVYDTVSGRHLLIPQGTRIVGTYDSKVAYAQERVLVVWTRLIYPNGDSIDLEGMGGVDMSGYAGLSDQVNNHYAKLLGGVILSTMLSTSAKITAGNNSVGTADIGQLAASGAGEEINKVGARLVEKNLNVQPTLEIRPGFKFNVFVSKDLILRPYKS
jgi:type IV secretion system protein TrbI